MYQTSRLPFSNSCTILFLFIDAFLIHALHSFIVTPSQLSIVHASQSCTAFETSHLFLIHAPYLFLIHSSHSFLIHAPHSLFMHQPLTLEHSRPVYLLSMYQDKHTMFRRLLFMHRTHLSFMRRILPLSMYHIHGLMLISLFPLLFMYQVEILARR